ncbi:MULTISPECIES: phytanoyl-CoA dioxygenase family protein [Chryseobacterium]|uniref:Phytanoyl-CoA hydroxylase n=1 Tax=Chryseobacterium camelliae TaxID=1265445 RepID=A0ABU0TGV4_9FLAO|nr:MULTISPECIES: phytanoyl-CoA dioxygenase family protein [Chryseobacterium]MDT3406151.1 phytanoyl-CoA hydroxylase [Pseudacidovorax intermedius]MDQ1096046.1 phytanoyl-CoA hydroxylase [Chryseobacterium camelliae]MDQ1099982.1 phytanoyl-CoA hydroxylase [Chryseobacterium sp. SORGH_AS_1048]MDR6087328.1 phytanoyl-CoA hydroxylase [Chryseobacterium sp. SORGH_AS_0909]MDR6131703.1 phytanoyl-CoA hydroxylase [Chryseobacterium sp. SORGH_AS_1175]
MLKQIRNYKLTYVIYNFFNKKKLKHNIPLYRKFGIRKSYFSSISSKNFLHLPLSERKINFEKLIGTDLYSNLSEENKASVQEYDKNGFIVLRNYIDTNTADEINTEIEKLMNEGTLKFRYGGKLMFAIHHSEIIRSIGNDEKLLEFLSILLDGNAKLFQSINFINGSQQKTHSDSIHMTTYPLGGLLGVWIALEDVDENNGALHYIPQSHKLPYFLNSDYDNEGSALKIGKQSYKAYEEFLEAKVKELGLQKEIFRAKKGDLLIWHANILHGGEPHLDKSRTRKSLVYHYFDKDSICYHEVTQRPALFQL